MVQADLVETVEEETDLEMVAHLVEQMDSAAEAEGVAKMVNLEVWLT